MSKPKISVITVVFNSEKFIEETIKSIINQDYGNLEYIIIDGKSTDRTMEIVEKYSEKISKIISENDSGLYDAMNKGLRISTGDFVMFINSGDRLAGGKVLSEIFSNLSGDEDVIYGDTDIIDFQGNIIHSRRHRPPENLRKKDFLKGMLVCHQSFIARRELCEGYDLTYRYAADYDWCLRVLEKSSKNFNSHKTISLFMEGGQTQKTIVPGLKERYKIMCRHFGWFRATFWNGILAIKFFWWILFHKWF
ncbi:MAG: glycosyltransferase [Bacteroidales bacterium]|nr:glycosyltransferase [Bacteroidales bacterium]